MAIHNPYLKEFEVELPKLSPIVIRPTREIRRRKSEEHFRKVFRVNKTKKAVAFSI